MKRSIIPAAALLLALALAASPLWAQQRKTVEGVVINIGLVNALTAEHVDAQHGVHQGGHGSGAEHIVVTLDDALGGGRIVGAKVRVEVRDPKGRAQTKLLLPMKTAGMPDYSEVFDFGWSGRYSVLVSVTPKGAAKPVAARFTVNHYIP